MIDKTFSAKLTLTFTGEDSGKEWDAISYASNGLDANEVKQFCTLIPPVVQSLLSISSQFIEAGIASGDVAKPT